MLTKEDALNAREFHYNGHNQSRYSRGEKINCSVSVGPRGGVKISQLLARRNGQTQTWKTRPSDYRIPIVYGLKGYGEITHQTSDNWHTNDTCPLTLAETHLWPHTLDIPHDYTDRMRAVQTHLTECADCREGKR